MDFATKFGEGLGAACAGDATAVRGALDAGMEALSLTGEDLARAAAVQKALAATGASPEDLAQLLLLQKALAAGGASPGGTSGFRRRRIRCLIRYWCRFCTGFQTG